MGEELLFLGLKQSSQDLIDLFLDCYKKSSHINLKSALRILLGQDLKKVDVTSIVYGDYLKIKEKYDDNTQFKYKKSFIQFLYTYDFIKDPSGFEVEEWSKKDLQKRFDRSKQERQIDKYEVALSFEQIDKIQTFMDLDYSEDEEKLKLSFIWYMLFHTDCDVTELKRKVDCVNYDNGLIVTEEGKEYEIPEKFDALLKHIKTLKNTCFNSTNIQVKKIGRYLGINGLTPQTIKDARKQNLIQCFMCGEKFLALNEYWKSVNGRIACYNCAESIQDIKKNVLINDLDNNFVEILTEAEKVNKLALTRTFESLRKEFDKKIDFEKLHEYQMLIGRLGEAYVYKLEKEKLLGTKYYEYIDDSPAYDNKEGYDILSYDLEGNPLYIEVKSTSTNEDLFYITTNELNKAKEKMEKGQKYLVYRVKNVLSKNYDDITLEIYDNIFDGRFTFEELVYKVHAPKKNA